MNASPRKSKSIKNFCSSSIEGKHKAKLSKVFTDSLSLLRKIMSSNKRRETLRMRAVALFEVLLVRANTKTGSKMLIIRTIHFSTVLRKSFLHGSNGHVAKLVDRKT